MKSFHIYVVLYYVHDASDFTSHECIYDVTTMQYEIADSCRTGR